jgi:hypothetical protein
MRGRKRLGPSDVLHGDLGLLLCEANDGTRGLCPGTVGEVDPVTNVQPAHAHVMRGLFAEPRDVPVDEWLAVREEPG